MIIYIDSSSKNKIFPIKEVIRFKEVLWQLTFRDITLRYKQATLGVIWAIIQAVLPAVIFTAMFGTFLKIPSDGSNYFIFVFSGLTMWNFFSQVIMRGGNSLITNSAIITKVYFPRVIIPLSSAGAVVFDLIITTILLVAVTFFDSTYLSYRIFLLPLIFIYSYAISTGISLLIAALNVKYRDFLYALPFLLQVWLYCSPVVYSSSAIPEKYLFFYALNPAVLLIELMRWVFTGTFSISLYSSILSLLSGLIISIYGLTYFNKMERSFADNI